MCPFCMAMMMSDQLASHMNEQKTCKACKQSFQACLFADHETVCTELLNFAISDLDRGE